jgi:hypothetical protein
MFTAPCGAHNDTPKRLRLRDPAAELILFDSFYSGAKWWGEEFDLVITPQTRPEEWLRQIADLIERSHALMARSTVIRERSARLIRDSEILRENLIFQRERFAREEAKAKRIIENIEKKSEPSDK